jgi:hypothetical protein
MNIGRIILTYRQDMILPLKKFYLDSGRTDFLVISYNEKLVDPTKFQQADNFKLEPYLGKGENGDISGQQFLAWVGPIKKYPEIQGWAIHDYDLLAKPDDIEIFQHLKPGQYGSLGKPFPIWQRGMSGETTQDLFPYPYHYISEDHKKEGDILYLENILLKSFKVKYQNIPTILTGYSDFIAAFSKDILLLSDSRLNELDHAGLEQAIHTVFACNGLEQVDFRKFFSTNISLDNTLYITFENDFDFSHPVKFWPGLEQITLKKKIKRFLKPILKGAKYSQSLPGQ